MNSRAYPPPLQRLIDELARLPTIGPRSAERMALFLLNAPKEQTQALAQAMLAARQGIGRCAECHYFADQAVCPICAQKSVRQKQMCVVEYPQDVMAVEYTGKYKGLYYVLWGCLSPLDNTGPQDLPLRQLIERVQREGIEEVILATGSSREGEATALYVRQILQPLKIKISRIARGIPVGSTLGHSDRATLAEAMSGRQAIDR
ncbi:MAG: recombination mediator RecR [Candidatus Omnitrophica bacterium]|nr:recombination mediator RecR [Candidatus Omnitrophota bacterium]